MRKRYLLPALLLVLLLSACVPKAPSPKPFEPTDPPTATPEPTPEFLVTKNTSGSAIYTRFSVLYGFERVPAEDGSFAQYIRALTLKSDGSTPNTFNGLSVADKKLDAVVKWDVIKENMRNTNTLIRLRAEYLYSQGLTSEIEYHFLSGFVFSYSKWAEGYRINVTGSKVDWVKSAEADDSEAQFQKYLSFLYAYTNATAIGSDLIPADSPQIGDVFTEYGGIMIADIAKSDTQTAVILIKGSSPACEPYVMQNTAQPEQSPWFVISDGGMIYTEECTLDTSLLKRFAK